MNKVKTKEELLCYECGIKKATVLVSFTSKTSPVIDYPACDTCLKAIGERYKSTWAGTQICLKSVSEEVKE